MDHSQKTQTGASSIKDFVIFIVVVIAIVWPIRTFIAQPFVVSGSSMVPTFTNGQYLIIDQLSYRFHAPERGDVVVFKYPKNEKKYYIKRIIGLPGETITVNGTIVTISNTEKPEGFVLDQPYIEFQKDSVVTTTLQADEYFVMGDNRAASSDSRVWGPVPERLITGKVFVRLWPFSEIDYLPGEFIYE